MEVTLQASSYALQGPHKAHSEWTASSTQRGMSSTIKGNRGTYMQEQDAALEQARAEAERLGPALQDLQELQTRHQDMCERCGPPFSLHLHRQSMRLRPQMVTATVPGVLTSCMLAPSLSCLGRLLSRLVLCMASSESAIFRVLHFSLGPSGIQRITPELPSMDCADRRVAVQECGRDPPPVQGGQGV